MNYDVRELDIEKTVKYYVRHGPEDGPHRQEL
jgi:hypothetical protein